MRTLYRPVWGLCLLVLLLPWVSGCDSGSVIEPDVSNDTFRSYVALGNSITAGFQSNGIVDSTQRASYANLLAKQMGTPFNLPLLNAPGCPPPVDDIFRSSLRGPGGPACDFRRSPLPSTLHNVAVPGAQVFDALSNVDPNAPDEQPVTSTNALTQFILGGRTQVQAALEADPTFASVWLGNNDVLGAALAGVPNGLDSFPVPSTPPPLFEQQYRSVVDSLVEGGVERGILIGVANPVRVPNLSPGKAFFLAEDRINQVGQSLVEQSALFDDWGKFDAKSNCASAPGANVRVPLRYFFRPLLTRALAGGTSTLDCDPSAAPEAFLTPAEQSALQTRVDAYNETIETIAGENGWAYLDMNPALKALYDANAGDRDLTNDLVPKLPIPSPDAPTFGRYFTEDGVHPSATTHRVVTHQIIQKLNEQYGDVELEQISIPGEVQNLLQ